MKKLFFILCAAVVAGSASAVDFGVRVGVNSSNFEMKNASLGNNYIAFNKAKTGYHAGLWSRIDLGSIFVQPEILYNWNSYDMDVWNDPTSRYSGKIKVQTLEVPALVGVSLLFLRLNAGPVFNVMNKTSRSGDLIESADVLKPSVSYAAGFGFDIMKLSLDVRYNGDFERTKQTVEIGGESYASKTNFRGWTVGLGYRF